MGRAAVCPRGRNDKLCVKVNLSQSRFQVEPPTNQVILGKLLLLLSITFPHLWLGVKTVGTAAFQTPGFPVPCDHCTFTKPGRKQPIHLHSARTPEIPSKPWGSKKKKASFSLEGASKGNLTMLATFSQLSKQPNGSLATNIPGIVMMITGPVGSCTPLEWAL